MRLGTTIIGRRRMDFNTLVPSSNCLANYLDLNSDVVTTHGMRRGVGLLYKRAYDRGFVGCFADDPLFLEIF